MRCWVRITGRWSAPIAIRPTRICRCDAGKSAGLICGAPSRSSWPGAERPSASVTTCWTAASSCLPGGIKSATVPCPGPASKTISTICVCAFGFICAMGSGSPTPRRRPPAPISSTSDRPCGPSHAGPASSRPTTTPNEALRHGVLWRHTSFGTHSAEGSRFVERLLTVRDTLGQQQRNVLDYLRMACTAAVSQQPAPSLLPSAHSPIR